MHDYRELSWLMERTINKYIQIEKQTRCYGTRTPLTQSEIHTIVIVGDYPDINITKLAKIRGITKGAASQMIYKLVDKGFIEKQVSPSSDTEVCLTLTEDGRTAHKAHSQYHDDFGKRFFKILNDIPEEYQEYMIRILTSFDKELDECLKQG